MASNLVTTKLMPPVLAAQVVERPQLKRKLETSLATKLILVAAPAGSGKSTLLASWLKEVDRPTAWLSLDASDNDLERFLLYLVSALQQAEPGFGVGLPELLQTQNPVQSEPVMTRLINEAAQLNRNLILVLDDYHLITNEKIHEAVEFFLDRVPLGLCLVIASRTDPPLALSRLRVGRHLVEVRADQLRFSLEETTTFLNDRLHLELSHQAVASLEERTEGWIAGLQLAALSLEGRSDKEGFVQRFAGSHRYLVDYLMDEVLVRQAPEVRLFLQRTSILERFTASLCQAVSEQQNSANILKQLASANLFLIALDEERHWYRYHHLFAEFLRHRLLETEAESVPELHRRASEWLEQEGWLDEAIEHALAAHEDERAAQLVEEMAHSLTVHWYHPQLIRYVQRLPASRLAVHPRLAMYYGWALTMTGQLEPLSQLLPLLDQAPQRAVKATAVTFRATERLRKLDYLGAVALYQEVVSLLSDATGEDENLVLSSATDLLAYSYLYVGDLASAERLYPAAIALARQVGYLAGAVNGLGHWGRGKHIQGQLHAAMEIFDRGFGLVESRARDVGLRGRTMASASEFHLYISGLLYEWNRLKEAQVHLQRATMLNELAQAPFARALALERAFFLQVARSETEAARATLGQLDRLRAEVDPDYLIYQQLLETAAMTMRLRLATSDAEPHYLQEVAQWVKRKGLAPSDDFSYFSEGAYRVLAHLLVAEDKVGEALPLLERLVDHAETEGRNDDLIRYLILQALAEHALGRKSSALERALTLAEPEGYCRSFVDRGTVVQSLLERASRQAPTPYLTRLLATFPEQDDETLAAPKRGATQTITSSEGWLEPLNEREVTVLRLLSAGQSNKRIAKELNLSPNTVKWYLKGLYDKLGVNGRLQAVNRARDLGLF